MRKIADLVGFTYFFGLLYMAVFAFPEGFREMTSAHPYLMGFLKVSLLATFGEYLKRRLATGHWSVDGPKILILRFLGWGCFGLWFSMAFPMFSSGLESLVKTGLWPDGSPLWIAFSKSLCINVIGCFGWTMMLSHEWINMSIAAGKFAGLVEFGDSIDKSLWFGTVPRTILLFWLPAHTITFSLPGVWRILMAASLSVVLGFLLTAGKQNIGSVNSAVSIESVSFTGSNDSDYK